MIQYIVKVLYSVRKLKVLKVFDDEDLINTQMGTRGRIRLSGGDVAKRKHTLHCRLLSQLSMLDHARYNNYNCCSILYNY